MSVTLERFGLDRLPVEDRLELLELLWESLSDHPITPPDWHIQILEQRRAAMEANPSAGIPWEEFKTRWLQPA